MYHTPTKTERERPYNIVCAYGVDMLRYCRCIYIYFPDTICLYTCTDAHGIDMDYTTSICATHPPMQHH